MKLILSFVVVCLTLIVTGESHASYSTTIIHDYGSSSGSSPASNGNGSYVSIAKSDAAPFSDSFTLTGLAYVTAGTISISHNGNFDFIQPNGFGEQWQALLNGKPVGTLSNSFYDWNTGNLITGWQTDTFTLNSAALAAINAGSPSPQATISFLDTTLGANTFNVNSVSLSVAVANAPLSTPLPAALTLFAPGLFGLAALRRRLS